MNDQQLKIRIKLNQIPQFPEAVNSEEIVNQTKPPFDWRKISAAGLLFAIILGGILWWFAEESSQPIRETLSSEDTQSINSNSLVLDKNMESNDLSANNSDTSSEISAPAMEPVPEATPTPEPIVEATTNLGYTIIPLKKPEIAKNKTTNQSAKAKEASTDQSHVIKAQLTSAIQQQEAVDNIDHVWLDQGTSQPIYFFLHLRGLKGKEVSVNWFYQDKEVAKIPLVIEDDNWRTHSNKMLNKTQMGQWRVEVQDQSGKLLAERAFTVNHRSQ
ncbi:DUF2914 domain-containing protein [Nitrosomonas sp. Is37]|uniref:DUF2914 domain-containing protein n=1 Tax=Nitrosomonas sp. Is37 TaxID=3080535 RepID=UPI00294B8B7D|nr:DUF2914 domain-containing protein [Nitrosomonas sp. Is37]MDV6343288.1 DUF2914 domain-containing protein [Nitrosomonas sp. Is37]